MHPIFPYLIAYMVLGALGMYFGSRRKPGQVRKERWLKYFVYVFITAFLITSIFYGFYKYAILVIIAASFFELVSAGKKLWPDRWLILAFGLSIYITLAFGAARFAYSFERSIILLVYFQVFIFDAFSQVTGQLVGKHKLIPTVSPAKTIEGLCGGILFCIVSAAIGTKWTTFSISAAMLYGCLTSATCFAGDLMASWFKRLTGIKDYGKILPGQGGFLDRYDSLIMTTAAYYFLFY